MHDDIRNGKYTTADLFDIVDVIASEQEDRSSLMEMMDVG